MKNLANCKPSEFLAQTYKIKKEVEAWLNECGLPEIRAKLPKLEPIPENATDIEKERLVALNRKRMHDMAMQNFMEILDAALGKNADRTLRIMALCCFMDPLEIDNCSMSDILGAVSEVLNDKNVISFFTSLVRLGQTNTASVSEK